MKKILLFLPITLFAMNSNVDKVISGKVETSLNIQNEIEDSNFTTKNTDINHNIGLDLKIYDTFQFGGKIGYGYNRETYFDKENTSFYLGLDLKNYGKVKGDLVIGTTIEGNENILNFGLNYSNERKIKNLEIIPSIEYRHYAAKEFEFKSGPHTIKAYYGINKVEAALKTKYNLNNKISLLNNLKLSLRANKSKRNQSDTEYEKTDLKTIISLASGFEYKINDRLDIKSLNELKININSASVNVIKNDTDIPIKFDSKAEVYANSKNELNYMILDNLQFKYNLNLIYDKDNLNRVLFHFNNNLGLNYEVIENLDTNFNVGLKTSFNKEHKIINPSLNIGLSYKF